LRWTFQTELVHAQRELYFGLKVLNKVKKPSKELKKILGDCKRVFELVKKAYAEKNIGVLEKIHELNNSLEKEGYETLKKSSSEERIIVHHILSSLRNFYVITSPLMGLFMHN
jgi:flagellar motor component MotA